MKKKFLFMLMLITLSMIAFGTLTASAATEGIYTYTVSNGEATITDCYSYASGEIVIPATLGGYPVTGIGDSAFEDCYSLTSVSIPDGVTSIGNWAFNWCDSLSDVYYAGSQDEWNNINIGSGNSYLTNATIHFNSIPITISYINLNNVYYSEEIKGNTTTSVPLSTPIRTGHTFLGWATDADAKAAEYLPGDAITAGTEDITLYAVWNKTSYTSTSIFEGNGYKIYQVSLTGVPTGSTITFACYNGGKLAYIESRNDINNTIFMVPGSVAYDDVKVFVWDGFSNLIPVTEPEDVI